MVGLSTSISLLSSIQSSFARMSSLWSEAAWCGIYEQSYSTSLLTGANCKWATQGAPRSCTHEGYYLQSCIVAWNRQWHRERACGCKQCFKTWKAPQAAALFPWSCSTAPWQHVYRDFATHWSVQPLPHYGWCSFKVVESDWSHHHHNSQCYVQQFYKTRSSRANR